MPERLSRACCTVVGLTLFIAAAPAGAQEAKLAKIGLVSLHAPALAPHVDYIRHRSIALTPSTRHSLPP